VHDVIFRDLRVEYQANALPEVYQRSDEQVYDPGDRNHVPRLIYTGNPRFQNSWDYMFDGTPVNKPAPTEKTATVHDILYEDIAVTLEPGVAMPESVIESIVDGAKFDRFLLKNITVNGKRITNINELNLKIKNGVSGVVLE